MRGLLLKLAVYFGVVIVLHLASGEGLEPGLFLAALVIYVPARIGFALPGGIILKVIATMLLFGALGTFAGMRVWPWIVYALMCVLDILWSVYVAITERRTACVSVDGLE